MYVYSENNLGWCPFGTAWAGKASSLNSAHISTECSGQGLCDRSSGICACMPGFEGGACQRAKCGMSMCGRNGKCVAKSYLFNFYNTDNITVGAFGSLNTWDSNSTTACVCDRGFTGPGCTMSKFRIHILSGTIFIVSNFMLTIYIRVHIDYRTKGCVRRVMTL